MLQSLSDTISLSSPVYSESSTHPLSEPSSWSSLSKSMKSIYPMFQKLIFLWLAIIFLPIWMSRQRNRKSSLPSLEGCSFWNRFQFGYVFQDNNSRIGWMRASFRRQREHNHDEQGRLSVVRNVLNKASKIQTIVQHHLTWKHRYGGGRIANCGQPARKCGARQSKIASGSSAWIVKWEQQSKSCYWEQRTRNSRAKVFAGCCRGPWTCTLSSVC